MLSLKIIKNELGKNGPQELGFDRNSGQLYGNKEFLANAVNYLLDENGLINIRTKEIAVAPSNPLVINFSFVIAHKSFFLVVMGAF